MLFYIKKTLVFVLDKELLLLKASHILVLIFEADWLLLFWKNLGQIDTFI